MTYRTFVLAHGSWHGGWCWTLVRERLRQAGHEVFAPSFSGMGDRAHLLHGGINLETFIQDLVAIIEAEDLRDVVLVGHSFGGGPITGVADRIPERIRRLVYLDAIVLQDGESMFSTFPEHEATSRTQAALASTGGVAVPVPDELPDVWGIEPGGRDWVRHRLTPHPLAAYTTALSLRGPVGNNLPRTYVACTRPYHPALERYRALVRGQPGWEWIEVSAPHDVMLTHPAELARLLLKL